MRALALALAALLCAAPAQAQAAGSIQVSLTILEPATAAVQPRMELAPAPGGVHVTARLNLRGAAAWTVLNASAFAAPPADEAARPGPAACESWAGSAVAGQEPLRRDVTVRARCTVAGRGERSASAPLVIMLATN